MSQTFEPDILIIGGAHIDRIGRSTARLEPGQSNPGTLKRNVGGVAGNIAQCLARLDWNVTLSSICGRDADADLIQSELTKAGIDLAFLVTEGSKPSASYTAIEDRDGSLIAGIADMSIYDSYPPEKLADCLSGLSEPTIIVADTNLPVSVLDALADKKGNHFLAVSAVSGPKANRAAEILEKVDLLFCNEAEAAILAQEFAELDALPEILMEIGVKAGIITKGGAGLSAWQDKEFFSRPAPPVKVRSTNGAGDALAASMLHALLLQTPFDKALDYGMAGASLALMSEQTVPDMLNRSMLEACIADIPT
ncbi:carbohydrate kinase family protein [uncultured Cohaesibacter sp.]|uniref:carbohydrate kinase family protein n=1 Tax=uncultured Cohaesibacter sp. TaxID=1002546 RepID=UPI002931043A|nr:carbohydrate kinase family protein [uncultured Cohaesibacter sp.]